MSERNAEQTSDLPYRPCAGIMVLNRDGLVWMGHRPMRPKDEFPDGSSKRWQMPQGGIDEGEDPLDAARRELWEETGIRSATHVATLDDWLFYDLPAELIGTALKGKYRGQRQAWFVFRFEGDDAEINITHPPDGSKPEFDRWEWVPMNEIPDRIVEFKRPIYERLAQEFAHLAGSRSAEPNP